MPYEHILFDRSSQKKIPKPVQFSVDSETSLIPSIIRTNPVGSFRDISAHSKKFHGLVNESVEPLFRAQTVFPFEVFPDRIIIDHHKVTLIHTMFFFSYEIQSIFIHNIKDVITDTSLLFGSLRILPDGYNETWADIKHLWKKDAIKARNIISGLILGYKEGINIRKVETQNLQQQIESLGMVN